MKTWKSLRVTESKLTLIVIICVIYRKDLLLVMSEAGDPVDIVWRNMGGTRGVYFFRKFIFNIIGIYLYF